MSEATVTLSPETRRAIYADLRGFKCACGARKKSKQSFCRVCYFRLPAGTRINLYEPTCYPETFAAACAHLGHRLPGEKST